MRDESVWVVWCDVMKDLLTSLPHEHWDARSVGIAGAILATILVVVGTVVPYARPLASLPLADLPSEVAEWSQQYDLPITDSVYAALGTRDILNRVYSGRRQNASLFIARWAWNSFATSGSSSNLEGWSITRQETKLIPIRGGIPLQVNSATAMREGVSALVLYWYQNKRATSRGDSLAESLLSRWGLVIHRRDRALIRVILIGDESGYDGAGSRFVQALYPELSNRL
jgi:hypothetical protein